MDKTARSPGRRLAAVLAISVACTVASTGTSSGKSHLPTQEPSPGGCSVQQLDNPHIARSVPNAVKVNAKAQCAGRIPEQSLTVTMIVDGAPFHRTTTEAFDQPYLWNQSTFVVCKGFTQKHTFQGAALGVSWEEGRPYLQARQGPVVEIRCDL